MSPGNRYESLDVILTCRLAYRILNANRVHLDPSGSTTSKGGRFNPFKAFGVNAREKKSDITG